MKVSEEKNSLATGEEKLPENRKIIQLNSNEYRIIKEKEKLYRFVWEIHYRNGRIRKQYERCGEVILQTLFGKIEKEGIAKVLIFDVICGMQLVAKIDVPEGAKVNILYNTGIGVKSNGENVVLERIYTFGWQHGEKGEYLYVKPTSDGTVMLWTGTKAVI